MGYETVKRNRYYNQEPLETANHASKNHYEDLHDFHIPLERMHNSNLHDWGVARGLEVSGTIGGNEIIVNPGVAVDSDGQLISLSDKGHGDIGRNPSAGESREETVPVHLSTEDYAGKTYITIQFSQILRGNEGVLGRLEQVPWVRLQSVDTYDGKSIVLAIAVIDETGKLAELKTADDKHRRRLVGESIEELRIQKSSIVGHEVQEVHNILSGKISQGDAGGLKITVPDPGDSILFAREKDGNFSNFANLEIRSNVGIGISSPSEKLEVNGTVKADKFVGDGSGLIKAGQWTDVEGGISYNAGNVGIGTTSPSAKLEVNGDIKGSANLVISGNVGIGTTSTESTLSIGSSNFRLDKSEASPNAGYIRFGDNTGWKFHIGRSQESVGSSFNRGTTGVIMTIQDNGRVGIGTANPGAKLVVSGDVIIAGNLGTNGFSPNSIHAGWAGGIHTWDVEAEGSIWCKNGIYSAASVFTTLADLAENYPADMDLELGDVVCLDKDKDRIVLSEKPSDPLVIGVVSTKPGFLLNSERDETEIKMFPVALCGRIPCKVVDENGSIKRGDLLTTSSTAGHAMKANSIRGEEFFAPGTIIGKAIDTLDSGKGVIDIFVFSS